MSFEVKGDDVNLANDCLKVAFRNEYDTAILVSGDEDFMSVVKTLKELNKRVENAYFKSSSSERLRKVCDYSIKINNFIEKLK